MLVSNTRTFWRLWGVVILMILSDPVAGRRDTSDIIVDRATDEVPTSPLTRKIRQDHHRNRRRLMEKIGGYEPRNIVTDENAMDLDQFEIEAQLASRTEDSFRIARAVYEGGGFTMPMSEITLQHPLSNRIEEGSRIEGLVDGDVDWVKATGIVATTADLGETSLSMRYDISEVQERYSNECHVGALPPSIQRKAGCLASGNGTVTVMWTSDDQFYSRGLRYTSVRHYSGRSLQSLSATFQSDLYDCGVKCPKSEYEKFREYYGDYDYADEWIAAAFDGRRTKFTSRRGDADFSAATLVGRAEAIKRGTAYLTLWMEVIRQMELAMDSCDPSCGSIDDEDGGGGCNHDAVLAWDRAVAYYVGSKEGRTGRGDGHLLYSLSDRRCQDFRTCGEDGIESSGTSHNNIEIVRNFRAGQFHLTSGLCDEARTRKERISSLMSVPLVQAVLRYAYMLDPLRSTTKHGYRPRDDDVERDGGGEDPDDGTAGGDDDDDDDDFDGSERENAEGASFAAALIPLVYACNKRDGESIHEGMRLRYGSYDFLYVKGALQRNYHCMGIRCSDVGGLYDDILGKYYLDGKPCWDGGGRHWSVLVASSLGGLCIILIVVLVCVWCKGLRRRGQNNNEMSFQHHAGTEVPPVT